MERQEMVNSKRNIENEGTKLDNTRRKRLKIKVRTEEYWKDLSWSRAKKNDINLQF